jgi:hypothetical protein
VSAGNTPWPALKALLGATTRWPARTVERRNGRGCGVEDEQHVAVEEARNAVSGSRTEEADGEEQGTGRRATAARLARDGERRCCRRNPRRRRPGVRCATAAAGRGRRGAERWASRRTRGAGLGSAGGREEEGGRTQSLLEKKIGGGGCKKPGEGLVELGFRWRGRDGPEAGLPAGPVQGLAGGWSPPLFFVKLFSVFLILLFIFKPF